MWKIPCSIIDWVNKPLNLNYDSLTEDFFNRSTDVNRFNENTLHDFNKYINNPEGQEKFIINNLKNSLTENFFTKISLLVIDIIFCSMQLHGKHTHRNFCHDSSFFCAKKFFP